MFLLHEIAAGIASIAARLSASILLSSAKQVSLCSLVVVVANPVAERVMEGRELWGWGWSVGLTRRVCVVRVAPVLEHPKGPLRCAGFVATPGRRLYLLPLDCFCLANGS